MATHKELVDYIQRSINSISPYEQGHTQTLYHAGFLASVLADLMQDDSHTIDKFKQKINKTKSKRNDIRD